MEMMNGFASCLIKVRQFHIGFPSLFSHYPEGMNHEELAEIHEYVQNAMNQPRAIPEAGRSLRRVIIGTGKYLIMGISGYAQYLAAGIQDIPHQLVDFTGRECPGFIGFVWNQEATPVQQIAFPSLSSFGAAFQELILEHWQDSKNSAWAYETRAGVEVPYNYPVTGELLPTPGEPVALNHDKKKLYSFDRSKESSLIYQAIVEAIRMQAVSLCSDLYFDSEAGSSFLNMTADLKDSSMVRLENPKFAQEKIPFRPEPEAEKEQYRTLTETTRSYRDEPNNDRTSKRNNTSGEPSKLTEVGLKFQYVFCKKAQWLEKKFLEHLVATCENHGYPVGFVKTFSKEVQKLTIHVHTLIFTNPILVEDFQGICNGILGYFCDQEWVRIEKGRCMVKNLGKWTEFRVFVLDKKNLFLPIFTSKKEIHLGVSNSTRQSDTSRHCAHTKSKKKNPDTDPQVSISCNPLIQTVKQSNQEKQEKKPREDNDLFKL